MTEDPIPSTIESSQAGSLAGLQTNDEEVDPLLAVLAELIRIIIEEEKRARSDAA
jgi:hypothetical protein